MTVIQHCPTIDTSIETDVYDNKAFLGSSWRSKLMEALVRFHYRSYSKTHYKHKQAWGLKVTDLLTYPKGSLAFELA